MNLYDLNKQIISQMPALDEDGIDLALMTVATYIKNTENKYYMLLCKDVNYYTLFNVKKHSSINNILTKTKKQKYLCKMQFYLGSIQFICQLFK
jgi:hypothetical protein